jgi:hypothetical protein
LFQIKFLSNIHFILKPIHISQSAYFQNNPTGPRARLPEFSPHSEHLPDAGRPGAAVPECQHHERQSAGDLDGAEVALSFLEAGETEFLCGINRFLLAFYRVYRVL